VWASPAFRSYCRETLSVERLKEQRIFRPDVVARLWADHEAGRSDNSARLWSLVLATRWLGRTETQLGSEAHRDTQRSVG
jgi:asparagine synthase (glutamine-hydrolysing)